VSERTSRQPDVATAARRQNVAATVAGTARRERRPDRPRAARKSSHNEPVFLFVLALASGQRRGLPMAYKPVPFSPDLVGPDLSIGQVMHYLGLSARSVQRLCQTGAV
jgi:hypothetical protein